jgi:sortase A
MYLQFASLFAIGVGFYILTQVTAPLVALKMVEIVGNNQNITLADPAPDSSQVLGISIVNENDFPSITSYRRRDYPAPYSEFKISIPALKINQAKVLVDSNDFNNNLGHLPGSALPGERGNVFISGHSSLSLLFKDNPYKTIFSKLDTLRKGDQITVETPAQKFEYEVKSLKIVDPKDTTVINPPDDLGRYLSLMTCVPPGIYFKRLVVLAELK